MLRLGKGFWRAARAALQVLLNIVITGYLNGKQPPKAD